MLNSEKGSKQPTLPFSLSPSFPRLSNLQERRVHIKVVDRVFCIRVGIAAPCIRINVRNKECIPDTRSRSHPSSLLSFPPFCLGLPPWADKYWEYDASSGYFSVPVYMYKRTRCVVSDWTHSLFFCLFPPLILPHQETACAHKSEPSPADLQGPRNVQRAHQAPPPSVRPLFE